LPGVPDIIEHMDISDKNIFNVYKNYETSDYIIDNFADNQQLSIFLPNQKNPFSPENPNFPGKVIDKNNDYKINELGFRGKLNDNPDILAVGCSYTFGIGVPEDGTWPNILSSAINKDVLNLGLPGTTIKEISKLIFKYVSKYNKPKTIVALFPPFFRTTLIEDVEFYSSIGNMNPKKQKEIVKQFSFSSQIVYNRSKKEIFFKKQFDLPYIEHKEKNIVFMENVFSPHQLISDAIDSISMIEDFCYSHGIDFYWSLWDNPSSMIMESLVKIPNFKIKKYTKFADDEFNNYQTIDNKFPNNFCNLSHNSKLADHPSWDIGSDVFYFNSKPTSISAHPGIHFQHHVADLFKGCFTF